MNKSIDQTEANPGTKPDTGLVAEPNKWSSAVRAWVRDFKQAQRGEPLPAFDSSIKGGFRSRYHALTDAG